MHRISHWLSRHAAALFFPAALILYDFSAYLTTDLIQPGILHVVRDFNADVALAPASVSLYMAGGMALQWLLGPLSDRIGRRPVLLTGALIFTLACLATLFTTSMTQFLIARFVQGTSICFIATVGYVTVQEAFEEKKIDQTDGGDHLRRAGGADRRSALRRGADAFHSLESAVRHYRRPGIGGLARPAVDHAGDGAPRRCAVQPRGRAARFSQRLSQPHLFTRRRHAVAELYSADELGGGIAGDFNGRRRTDHQRVRLEPVPVFSAVIIANLSVARWVKTPPARALSSARCRYRCSAWPS